MVNEYAGPPPQELETFLPQEGTNGTVKYKITPRKDIENGAIKDEYNPFKERNLEHPTTDGETLTHLLKASLGTGILAMPVAFMYAGLAMGIFATILTAVVCTHCSYILVKCAHTLYRRTRQPQMNFAEVAEVAFANGPKWGRGFAKMAKWTILNSLFITYFGTCSVYSVIVATNFQQVFSHWLGLEINLRVMIVLLLIPLILLAWVPNLKYLAPVSMVANVFMAIGLGITMYYLVTGIPEKAIENRDLVAPIYTIPAFFSITIFAMEAIGVVMPLENQMKTPENLVGICGVLNRGMSGVTLVYMLVGFMGYLRYGADTEGSITLNLPTHEIPAQIVKVLIALAVFCTFGLQFYVCLEIGWDAIKANFPNRPTLANYTMRTIMVMSAVLLAVAVPTISPFIGLIGAFCFSVLGLLCPVFIEMVTYWDEGFGPCNWIIWKNVVVCAFGVMALIFGSRSAILEIIKLYTDDPESPLMTAVNATAI
ncbi:proton-coupled amino acid transporter-like protein pathetic isoform X1 [Phlebotomus papatasi]|uniref:proton-coupled amino acid transporter-like protein pathetic isoform X1 n=1 Tax=Phlebotomus papatasi TaxID=29031 RepID=UPI002484523E|nr:proton-coupled amino acid transporter-like protein pathetic isoform X1 [Phlebotomus papatasi]XP_055702947.1 proton-coupled amino acid transporter-like protein pathetic isoform X1 [Phlebotomus papatasi]XP_055702948.1 proton-coupled amino acid transporter-like protein pathetic isoform X1 [Phlebotomus papatasi]